MLSTAYSISPELTEQENPVLDGIHHKLLMLLGHELGSPLTFILAYLRLWQERQQAIDRDELNLVVEQALTLKARLDDLMLLDQLESGLWRLIIEPVTVREVVDAVIQRRAPLLQERCLTLVTDLEWSEPLLADREMLIRALDHLLVNACKFSSAGGTVKLTSTRRAEMCRISVVDQGIGIPEEQYSQIFEPFFQADQTRTRRYNGLGLGLKLVRAIMEKHDGCVQLDSRVGEGSTFTLILRVA